MTNRILLVDDDEFIREVFQEGLEKRGFEVVPAATVNEALRLISAEKFEVLLTDLRMPEAGDGFTVVSAMRRTDPSAITLVVSGFPALEEAMSAILLQADEIILKPASITDIAGIITKKLANPLGRVAMMAMEKQRAGVILERETESTIQNWMTRVQSNAELTAIPLGPSERTGHLHQLMSDLVGRLRHDSGDKTSPSVPARDRGILRCKQGYSIPMMVEESRLLQVSIFNTLQNNLARADFNTVLKDVMSIADEVDAQLKQAVVGFLEISWLTASVPKTSSKPTQTSRAERQSLSASNNG
jgi:ActR/RegA family two-component response regulator